MEIGPTSQQRRNRSPEALDLRVDKWIETGRQVVDGVAGNRPGQRRPFSFERSSGSGFATFGRWVGDKLDWLLEDEEDWEEPWQSDLQVSSKSSKRPLDAISRRASKATFVDQYEKEEEFLDNWPEDSSFRIDRWQRNQNNIGETEDKSFLRKNRQSLSTNRRPLPRSSRRRN